MNQEAQSLLEYWFSEEAKAYWFQSTPEVDQLIRNRYENLWQQAKAGELQNWLNEPMACLALIIIFDQLPLNMFRGQPASFATEHQAVSATYHALDAGYFELYAPEQKAFALMPLMHSEKLEDQDHSVMWFEKMHLTQNLSFAQHHHNIVKNYGRFPHRNEILGRESTEAELMYLASEGAFIG